ncbi:MAG TPA: type II secretion system protein [Acidimicrobiales bacterium]|nr:type II secretion system protein [Acidimicrobiales bacterium]
MFFNSLQLYRANKRGDETQLGFTLIELLIVIVVLGVLAAVTVFALSGVTKQSAAAACNSDASSVNVALQAWMAQNPSGPIPAAEGAWETALTGPAPGSTTTIPVGTTLVPITAAPSYLQTFPKSSHYTITIQLGSAPAVLVSTAANSTPAIYIGATPSPCAAAA